MKILALLYCGALLFAAGLPSSGAEEPAPATTGPVIPAPNTPDGFTVVNGRVFFLRDGKMMQLDRDVVLRVSPSGIITAFNGAEYAIPEGQVLTLTAGVAALPADSITAAQRIPAPLPGEIGGDAISSTSSVGAPDKSSFPDPSDPRGDDSFLDPDSTTDSLFADGSDIIGLSLLHRHRMLGYHHGTRRHGMNPTSANGTTPNIHGAENPDSTASTGHFTSPGNTPSQTPFRAFTESPNPVPRAVTAAVHEQTLGTSPITPSANNTENLQTPVVTRTPQFTPPVPNVNEAAIPGFIPPQGNEFNGEMRATRTFGGTVRGLGGGGFVGGAGGMHGGGGGHR